MTRGVITTPDNPGDSKVMLWIRDVALPYDREECLIWPFGRLRDGYGNIGRDGKAQRAHRYICEYVKGPPPTPEHHAAHSCGRGDDGCVSPVHLSWKTPSENFKEGERHPRRKLTPAHVVAIRALTGLQLVQETAATFGVTECTIRKIQSGKLWSGSSRSGYPFTDADIYMIRAAKGARCQPDLAERFGVSTSAIYRIQQRKTYRHVPEAAA